MLKQNRVTEARRIKIEDLHSNPLEIDVMAKFTKADYLSGDNFEDVPEKPYKAIIVSMTGFT